MTDAAVVADSAPVPDAPVEGAVIAEVGTNFNAPLGSQIPPDAVAKPDKSPKSIDDSLDHAIAKVKDAKAEPKDKPEAKPDKAEAKAEAKPDKPEQPRENGKFVSAKPVETKPEVKPSHTAEDAPARFTDGAKAKWASADPDLRSEVLRMQKELTDGYTKYKANAEAYEGYRELDELAKSQGVKGAEVFKQYHDMETMLRKDPIGGLETLCSRLGLSLRDVAAHVMGQTPEQNASRQDATIIELRNELASLKQQIGGVTETVQQQRQQSTLEEVNRFAAEHPRFEELAEHITQELKHGYSLSEAYSRAERLNPAPEPKEIPPAASSAAPPPAQPDKGQKSINGAPSPGLTRPNGKKRTPPSLDEALATAFGGAG